MIATYILIQTEAAGGNVAAALQDLPGVSKTASLAGPSGVIAGPGPDIDELAKLVALRVQALDEA